MLPSPPVDDRAIYDAFTSRFIFPTLAISVEIGLYELLHREPLRLPEVADALGLDHRATEAVVAVVAALGFLESGICLPRALFSAANWSISRLPRPSRCDSRCARTKSRWTRWR